MTSLLILFSVVFGALIGSFLNVVVWRVPRGESLVHPPSRCPNCEHRIRPYDNVPIFGWLWLRGRCRDCGAPISPRYPIVEAATTLAFGLVAWWFTSTQDAAASPVLVIALVAFLYLAAISIALALIDLDVFRLPNAIVLPAYPVLIVLLGATSLLTGDPAGLLRAAIGGVSLFAFYFIAAFIYPNGMGFGDVKLAGVLGFATAWLGWGQFAVGAFFPFLLGGLYGVVLLIARRAGRKSRIPFGPWMLGGAWIGIVVGEPIAHWYLVLVGLA